MRCLPILAVLLLTAKVSSAGVVSNPSFLGIEMTDFGTGCSISSVTNCSPAQDAGLRFGDVITGMDGKTLFDPHTPQNLRRMACDVLREQILSHGPGDATTYEVHRGQQTVMIKATLSTRADVQHRCFVGQQLPSIETTDIDNPKNETDLGQLRGKTTVLAWFRLDRCAGCGPVFDRIADGIAARMKGDAPPAILGITAHAEGTELPKRTGFSSTLPIAFVDEQDFREVTLKESDRIQIMVLDCHGVVRFVAPLAPSSDDLDAAVDEVLAAVEQADHLRTQRR